MSLIIKKCNKCNALVEVLNDCKCENCGISCCGEPMQVVSANNKEYSFEKHLPVVEVCGNYIIVSVSHVMEEKHYIQWIALATDNTLGKKFLKPSDTAKAIFPYVKGSRVYAYCNIHGLWTAEVE
ncbi:MAG: desulfoferrodoxin family protein [Sphaerochaetaceae bacterium]